MNLPHPPPTSTVSGPRLLLGAFLMLVAILSPGCAKKLVFVTHTSVGLDVSGTANLPNKVSFSYNRFEGALVPRNPADPTHGHSVYGGMDTDVKFNLPPQYSIQQTFATGKAAEYAAQAADESKTPQGSDVGDDSNKKTDNITTTVESHTDKSGGLATTTTTTTTTTEAPGTQTTTKQACCKGATTGGKAKLCDKPMDPAESTAPLVFITGTTFGLHLSVGEQGTPANALLGYRRSEATTIPIPVPTENVRSVYADISISGHIPEGTKSANLAAQSDLGGVRIKQAFATGRAAETLARNNTNIQEKLKRRAGGSEAKKQLQAFDANEHLVLEIIEKFSAAQPDGKEKIADKARKLKVVPPDTTVANFPANLRLDLVKKDAAALQKLLKFASTGED